MRKKAVLALLCLALTMSVFASCGKTYQVTFYPNNGQTETRAQISKGDRVEKPADPVKDGFRFAYWCGDEALTEEYDFSRPVKGDVSLYAKYTEIEYATVYFDANGGQIDEAQQTRTVETGTEIGALPRPARGGYTLKGWYESADGAGAAYAETTVVSASVTLYAVWERNANAIRTPDDLKSMTADGSYFLAGDIDMAGVNYQTKFGFDNPFAGYLDGNGFAIENLEIQTKQGFVGLFGCVSGEINNLKLRAVRIAAAGDETVYAGGITGYLLGGKIVGCAVTGSVKAEVSSKYLSPYVGGIAGRNDAGQIAACSYEGIVESVCSSGAAYAGGIAGYNGIGLKDKGSISDCVAFGEKVFANSVSGNTGAAYAGGIAGFNYGAVARCIAMTDTVYAKAWDYHAYAGGITGDNNGGTAQSCLAAVTLIEAKTAAGDSSTGFITGRNFLNGNQTNSFAFAGSRVTASPYDDSYLPYTRHYRQVSEFAPTASLTQAAWYKALGYGEVWKFEEGKFPSLHGESIAVPETAEAGTYMNPIAITSAAELADIDCNLSYVLQNDIDVSALNFEPIGTYAKPYYGVFDGNGYKITYSLRQSAQGLAGVFGYLNGTVKNLRTQAAVDITEDQNYPLYGGGVVGWNKGGRIENCHSQGTMALNGNGGYAGGVVGYNEGGRVLKSSSATEITLTVKNPTAYLGGVAGATSGNIAQSFSTGALTLSCGAYGYLGGITGKADDAELGDCYAAGALRLETEATGAFAGGLAGYMQGGAIANCYAVTTISSPGAKGGIAAYASECTVENAHWLKSEGLEKGVANSALDASSTAYSSVEAMHALADALNNGRQIWASVTNGLPKLGWQ